MQTEWLYFLFCEVNHIYQVIGQTRIDFAEFFFIGTTEKSILKSKWMLFDNSLGKGW